MEVSKLITQVKNVETLRKMFPSAEDLVRKVEVCNPSQRLLKEVLSTAIVKDVFQKAP